MGDAVNTSHKLTGIFKFVLLGEDSAGQNTQIAIALKSKRNAIENTAGWIAGYAHAGDEVLSAAKKFWPVSKNFCRAPELEVMAARRAMVDEHLASFRPTDYFTILDVKRERFVVVSEYIAEEDIEIGGVLEPAKWTQQNRFRALSELAKISCPLFWKHWRPFSSVWWCNGETHTEPSEGITFLASVDRANEENVSSEVHCWPSWVHW